MKDSANNSEEKSFSFASLINFIFLFFAITLLIVSLYRAAFGLSNSSFGGLLQYLSDTNAPQISVNIQDFFIYGDWGIFEFLRSFLNVFAQAFGVVVFLASNLINLFIYLAQFVVFLFV